MVNVKVKLDNHMNQITEIISDPFTEEKNGNNKLSRRHFR